MAQPLVGDRPDDVVAPAPAAQEVDGLKIYLASWSGTGPTALAAFDAALNHMGVANYNLLRLSSVIPPGSAVLDVEAGVPAEALPGGWGDRLYVVLAEQRAETPYAEAWAGIGWVTDPESGKGLFVEHEGGSEQFVRVSIERSLQALMTTRGVDFGEIRMKVVGAMCLDEPVCAAVMAVYQASDWDNRPLHSR